jgi:hypothetical protein
MRIGSVIVALLLTSACGGGLFRQYEYEEEMYLSLDGSATVYINSSVAALNALRGSAFDTRPNTPIDRDAVREFFASPVTRVSSSVKTSRRRNRRFVHVRIDVDDVRRLGEAPPFAWSSYQFARDGDLYSYRQTVGAAAAKETSANWTGEELVAFRMHLPSKIAHENAPGSIERGNILEWEQSLTDRLASVPLVLETRVETQSILYRTLWLFAATFVAVALLFVAVIWLIVRRGGRRTPAAISAANEP